MRAAVFLMLALSFVGCKPKAGVAVDPEKDKKHFEHRPKEGSQTLLGKIRDRTLDARDRHDANQLKTMLMADSLQGNPGPGDDFDWEKMIGSFKRLRELKAKGELKLYFNVRLGDPRTVLLYEKSIEGEEQSGLVLTADGVLHAMKKDQFAALTKPK